MNKYMILTGAAFALSAAAPTDGTVDIEISGLRNAKGTLHACLTRNPAHFPACKDDPAALNASAPASVPKIRFDHVPPGRYAIAVFHDQNSNRNLDKFAGIPKEGFAFSRNPSIKMRAPRFEEVAIDLGPGPTQVRLKMNYLL
jgi:uncharacterized protein (DUF2141 family)